MSQDTMILHDLLQRDEATLVQRWIDSQLSAVGHRADRISRSEVADQSRRFLSLLREAVGSGTADIQSPSWANARQMLDELSATRAHQGFSPSETAIFIFSLKDVLFESLRQVQGQDAAAIAACSGTPARCSTSWGSTRPRSISAAVSTSSSGNSRS